MKLNVIPRLDISEGNIGGRNLAYVPRKRTKNVAPRLRARRRKLAEPQFVIEEVVNFSLERFRCCECGSGLDFLRPLYGLRKVLGFEADKMPFPVAGKREPVKPRITTAIDAGSARDL